MTAHVQRIASRRRRGATTYADRPWLRHYDYWVPPHLNYPRRPLSYILDSAATERPGHPATFFMGASLTYRQLRTQSIALAAGLLRQGVGAGDRVGLMLPNCPQYFIAAFAVLRIGAVLVNINPAYTGRELEIIAADSGLVALVTVDSLAPMVLDLRARTAIRTVIVTSLAEYAAEAVAPKPFAGALALAELLEAPTDPLPPVSIDADQIALMQYTGGATGTPKGAMLTHANLFANVVQTESFLSRRARPDGARYLMLLPHFHGYGFSVSVLRGTWTGALQILLPKYTVDVVLAAIRDYRPTHVPAVPTVFASLLGHARLAEFGLDRVHVFSTGAAPCAMEIIERWESATGRTLYEGFGLTEASPVTHMTPQLAIRKPGTVGVPLPDTDMKIVDPETGQQEQPIGTPGELCIAGPQVMQGYWRHRADTKGTLRRDAEGRVWLYTGDIARMDEDGFTTIVARKKPMAIVNGFNVYPSEVERVLRMHPAVRQARVVRVPHTVQGEVIDAYVVLRRGAHVDLDVLRSHCRSNLAPYKRPRSITVREVL